MTAERHAFITGGGSGIGLAIAQKFAAEGVKVTIAGRNRAKLSETGFDFVEIDVADEASIQKAVNDISPIDIFVANAGAAETKPAIKTSKEMWDRMIAVNLTSIYLCSRIVAPQMIERGWGRFIAIGSTASLKGYQYCGAYAAAKHGVVGWIKCLALELAKTGVTANAICPGYTNTPLIEKAVEDIMSRNGAPYDDVVKMFTRDNPMNRLIEPNEVADLAFWLASDAAGSINGQALAVDGGETVS